MALEKMDSFSRTKNNMNLPIREGIQKAVLIRPLEGISYAAILKNLKSRVNPEGLGVTIGGIRETMSKDLLVEVRCVTKDTCAFGTWRWTAGGQTEAGADGGAARRGMLRVPALGSRGATSAPQERISPEMTTSRGLCIVQLFGRQPRIRSLRKAAMGNKTGRVRPETNKKKKQGGEADTASRWLSP